MTILDEAASLTSGDRQSAYGHPRENHATTAAMWTTYMKRRAQSLGVAFDLELDARDVCHLNSLQKISRDAFDRRPDNLIDLAGYARNAEMVGEVVHFFAAELACQGHSPPSCSLPGCTVQQPAQEGPG